MDNTVNTFKPNDTYTQPARLEASLLAAVVSPLVLLLGAKGAKLGMEKW
jgi:hypothetical protein